MNTVVRTLCLFASVTGSAHTQTVSVLQYSSSGTALASQSVSSTQDTSIALNSTTRFVDIIPSSSSADIPLLTFTGGPSSGTIGFYIGSDVTSGVPDFISDDEPPSYGGRHLKGIHATSLNGTCESILYGGVNGDFGNSTTPDDFNIIVDRLVRFDVGGNISGNFVIGAPGSTVCIIEAGAMSDQTDITVATGSLTRVRTLTGDLKAQIVVENGDIGRIESAARITGYGPTPTFAKKGKIGTTVAATEIEQFQGDNTGDQPMIRANEASMLSKHQS